MKPLGLAARLSLAATLASALVLGLFAWGLHHALQRAIAEWDRANLGAIGHHAAEMLAGVDPDARVDAAASLARALASFGVVLELTESGEVPSGAGAHVPLAASTQVVAVSSSRAAGDSLGRRLAPLYLSLALTLFVALLATLQASIYWGLVKPLGRVRRQLRTMERGPWHAPAAPTGVAEVVALARQVESVGESLGERVTQWVEAERRAGAEMTRLRLRAAALPLTRELHEMTSELLERGEANHPQSLGIRRLQEVAERLTALFNLPLDEMVDVSLAPRASSETKEAS